jgi:polysaccharide pyruvyl transferase WcaK-like protein
MKILHLASHMGNIGDNASHIGFRKILSSITQEPIYIDQLEIRRFYNSYSLPDKLSFDKEFASLANSYDLLVMGGGGFLDFWVEGSVTGTTLNIPETILDQITTPIFIVSMGCIPHKQIPEGNTEKFRKFLDALLNKKNTLVAVRNDGSSQVLKDIIGKKYFDQIPEVLDHGFFYENNGALYMPCEAPYVLINTTADQVKMLNRRTGTVDEEMFTDEMKNVIHHIIHRTDLSIVFAPHIYADYKAIDLLVNHIDNFQLRSRVIVTPHVQGDFGCNQIFSAYKNSTFTIGMRFHANVCSLAMEVPVFGIAALDRVSSVYESVNLPELALPVDENFSTRAIQLIDSASCGKLPTINPELLKGKRSNTINLYSTSLRNFGLLK